MASPSAGGRPAKPRTSFRPVSGRRLGWAALLVAALAIDLILWSGDGHSRLGGVIPVGVVVATALPTFGLLFLRAQGSIAAYVVAWLYTVTWSILIPTYQPMAALLIALYLVARWHPVRQALPFLVACGIPWALNSYDTLRMETKATVADASVTSLMWCVVSGLAWLAAQVGRGTSRQAAQREAWRVAEGELALQQERLRLARELHDIVAHSVTAIIMQAAGTRAAVPDITPRVATALSTIEGSAVQAMRELRMLLGLLQSDSDADGRTAAQLSGGGLARLVDTTRACGVTVAVEGAELTPSLSAEVDHVAYRVVQESLANVIKHGGAGTMATLCIGSSADGQLSISVRSVGRGDRPAVQSSGLGLAGIRARVIGLGGSMESGPTTDGAYLMAVTIPLVPTGPVAENAIPARLRDTDSSDHSGRRAAAGSRLGRRRRSQPVDGGRTNPL